jgi:hypothetical protein
MGRAGHGAVTQMWNKLAKLFHEANQSIRRANKQLTDATRNCLTGSKEKFAYEAIQIAVTSSSK